jgi:hypothetical protein
LVVLVWASGHEDPSPSFGFMLGGYTNDVLVPDNSNVKAAIVKIWNRSNRDVTITSYTVIVENDKPEQPTAYIPRPTRIKAGGITNAELAVYIENRFGSQTNRWRLRCDVQQENMAKQTETHITESPFDRPARSPAGLLSVYEPIVRAIVRSPRFNFFSSASSLLKKHFADAKLPSCNQSLVDLCMWCGITLIRIRSSRRSI